MPGLRHACSLPSRLVQPTPSCCNFLSFNLTVVRVVNTTTTYEATFTNGVLTTNRTVGVTSATFYTAALGIQFGRPEVASVSLAACACRPPLALDAGSLVRTAAAPHNKPPACICPAG